MKTFLTVKVVLYIKLYCVWSRVSVFTEIAILVIEKQLGFSLGGAI